MAVTRRRLLTAAASGLAGMPLLAATGGCARGQYLTDEGTLSLWYWDRSISDTLLGKVPKALGIDLKPQKVPYDYKSKLLVSLAGKAYVPDIAAQNEGELPQFFNDEDQWLDLTEFGADKLESDYLDWKWQRGVSPSGRFIGFPMDTGPTALYYRADILEEAGFPSEPAAVAELVSDWENYFAFGEELQAKTGDSSFLVANPRDVWRGVIGQLPERFMTEDQKFIGDQDHIRRAWDLAVESHRRGLSARAVSDTPDETAAINTGKVATRVGAVWWAEILQDWAPKSSGNWRVCRAPDGAGNWGGSYLGITKYCRDPEAAFEVIKWLQSPRNQPVGYADCALFPAAMDALQDESVLEPSKYFGGQVINDVFAESARNVQPVYLGPYHDPILNPAFESQLLTVWTGGKDPDRAWRDALTEIERKLTQRGLEIA